MANVNEMVSRTQEQGVMVNIGQVTPEDKRALEKLVRSGELVKWRGHWHPVPGASFGIGPLKTCWGTPDYLASLPQPALRAPTSPKV